MNRVVSISLRGPRFAFSHSKIDLLHKRALKLPTKEPRFFPYRIRLLATFDASKPPSPPDHSSAQEIPLIEYHWDELNEIITKRLKNQIGATKVTVIDKTVPKNNAATQASLVEIKVESPEFEGKSKVERSRLVMNSIKDLVEEIHGISISTSTPNQQPR